MSNPTDLPDVTADKDSFKSLEDIYLGALSESELKVAQLFIARIGGIKPFVMATIAVNSTDNDVLRDKVRNQVLTTLATQDFATQNRDAFLRYVADHTDLTTDEAAAKFPSPVALCEFCIIGIFPRAFNSMRNIPFFVLLHATAANSTKH